MNSNPSLSTEERASVFELILSYLILICFIVFLKVLLNILKIKYAFLSTNKAFARLLIQNLSSKNNYLCSLATPTFPRIILSQLGEVISGIIVPYQIGNTGSRLRQRQGKSWPFWVYLSFIPKTWEFSGQFHSILGKEK